MVLIDYFLEVLRRYTYLLRPKRADSPRFSSMAKVNMVARFLGSAMLLTRGMVPMVQSQHSSEGESSRAALTVTR